MEPKGCEMFEVVALFLGDLDIKTLKKWSKQVATSI